METVAEIRRGDVVLVPFPYVTDLKRAKTRPALVIPRAFQHEARAGPRDASGRDPFAPSDVLGYPCSP